jgi:hypothetical protein
MENVILRLDKRTAFQLQSNCQLQFKCSLYAVDTTAKELQTKRTVVLHADCNGTIIRLHIWFAVLRIVCIQTARKVHY